MTDERISSVQALRGISALAVSAIHFLDSHNNGPISAVVRDLAKYGFHGVTMFFVISGFVLPLALSRAGYTVSNFPRFALKRVVRLEPPYLLTVIAVTIAWVVAPMVPGFHGPSYVVDWTQLLSHVGYLAPLFDKPWIVSVFWTLLIEVQFYILIGLTYPLLQRFPAAWIVLLALPSALITNWHGLSFHLPMFLIGTTAFAWWNGSLSSRMALLIALGLAAYLASYRGPAFAIAALAAAAFILWTKPQSRLLLFLGTISYSFYLVHLPVGMRTIHLLLRVFPDSPIVCAAIALVAAIFAAWLMWRYVEKPSIAWAGRIRYGSRRPALETVAPTISSGSS
jgi:peptidoglycan/LPS O-acetylase OafA/YrhL